MFGPARCRAKDAKCARRRVDRARAEQESPSACPRPSIPGVGGSSRTRSGRPPTASEVLVRTPGAQGRADRNLRGTPAMPERLATCTSSRAPWTRRKSASSGRRRRTRHRTARPSRRPTSTRSQRTWRVRGPTRDGDPGSRRRCGYPRSPSGRVRPRTAGRRGGSASGARCRRRGERHRGPARAFGRRGETTHAASDSDRGREFGHRRGLARTAHGKRHRYDGRHGQGRMGEFVRAERVKRVVEADSRSRSGRPGTRSGPPVRPPGRHSRIDARPAVGVGAVSATWSVRCSEPRRREPTCHGIEGPNAQCPEAPSAAILSCMHDMTDASVSFSGFARPWPRAGPPGDARSGPPVHPPTGRAGDDGETRPRRDRQCRLRPRANPAEQRQPLDRVAAQARRKDEAAAGLAYRQDR